MCVCIHDNMKKGDLWHTALPFTAFRWFNVPVVLIRQPSLVFFLTEVTDCLQCLISVSFSCPEYSACGTQCTHSCILETQTPCQISHRVSFQLHKDSATHPWTHPHCCTTEVRRQLHIPHVHMQYYPLDTPFFSLLCTLGDTYSGAHRRAEEENRVQ